MIGKKSAVVSFIILLVILPGCIVSCASGDKDSNGSSAEVAATVQEVVPEDSSKTNAAEDTYNDVKDAVVGTYNDVADAAVGTYNDVKDAVVGTYNDVADTAVGTYNDVKDAAVGTYNDVVKWGKDLFEKK